MFGPTGRMEEGQRLVLLDQVQGWCADTRTKVTIKPVIDLNAELTAPGYEIPDRIREQVVLRDRTCVFPWCTRPARRSDVDHIIEYDHDAEAEGRDTTRPDDDVSNLAVPLSVPPSAQDPLRLDLPRWSRPGCSSGPAPTATTTCATDTEASPSIGPGLVTGARAPSSTNE